MQLERYTTLRKLIADLCQQYHLEGEKSFILDSGWCIYSSDIIMSLDSECYIDKYPDYDEDDNEILPEYMIKNRMSLIYTDEVIQDVVSNAIYQKSDITCEEIKMALDYYEKYDNFIAF